VERELDLNRALTVIRRRWLLVVVGLAAGLTAAAGYSAGQTTLYRSSTSLLVSQDTSTNLLEQDERPDQRRLLQNEVQFINSDRVVAAATEALGYPAAVRAGAADNADLLVITAESSDPLQAADIANAYATAFVGERQDRTIDAYLATAAIVQDRIGAVDEEVAALGLSDPRREALATQRESYASALEALNLGADLSGGVNTVILREATPASAPVQPRTTRNLVVGAAVGLLAGLGLAFARDLLDDRLRTPGDIEAVRADLANLAVVAKTGRRRRGAGAANIASVADPGGEVAEAYRTLRAALQFISVEGDVRVIQVTSPHTGEGKTTTAANLAVALARAGQRVILVDADLRRPQVAASFGVDPAPGLTDLLIRKRRPHEICQLPFDQEPLAVIAAGTQAPNPSELLGSKAARKLFGVLSDMADVVIVDSAPVLPVSDALALAGVVDGTILVVEARRTTAADLAQTLALLERVDARVLGTVLNRGEARHRPYEYASASSSRRRAEVPRVSVTVRRGPIRPGPSDAVADPTPAVFADHEVRQALASSARDRLN
jgi:capsular exopolysaccharide synthesis family protein